MKTNNKEARVIMASNTEVISPVEMILHNPNVAMLMLAISNMRYCDREMELSLKGAINEIALFSASDFFETDEKRIQFFKDVLQSIRGFYADGYRLIINPDWNK